MIVVAEIQYSTPYYHRWLNLEACRIQEDWKEVWLQNPKGGFYTHRSFSILVVCANAFLFWRNRKLELGFTKINWIIALLCLEIISGIAMYYFNFPFGTQTIHIVIATILFGLQFYLVLENFKKVNQ